MKVKVCCISSVAEANLALEYGADAIGLVGPMPSGPGIISCKLISEIVSKVPASLDTFFLTSETTVDTIVAVYNITQTSVVQLVDSVDLEVYKKLDLAIPNVKLVQVVHVEGENSIDYALEVSPYVDYILLDSGIPKKRILGGTGITHNWNISKEIVLAVKCPVFLAGGLNAENIAEAIETVQPYGVDLCSGVRTQGKLDEEKLNAFMRQVEKYS